MALENIGIRVTSKEHNRKKISDKTWENARENNRKTDISSQAVTEVETEEIDLEETTAKQKEINKSEEITQKQSDPDTGAVKTLGHIVSSVIEKGQDTVSGAYETVKDWVSPATNWIKDKEEKLKKFTVDANGVLLHTTEKANEIIGRVKATTATVAIGLVEGVGMFGEAIVDTGAVVGTGIMSIGTGIIDLGSYIVTGESIGLTKEIWDNTKTFVSEKYVSTAFDNFYEKTKYGKEIKEKAYGYETVRNISSGIGYTAGMIALTVATAGVGTAPTIAATMSSSATMGAGIAAIAGFGQGVEKAWGEGASVTEGLGYGTVKGALDGVSYYAGGKMAGKVIGNGVSRASKIATSAARIGFDAVDGGLSGVTDPAAQMIYKDGTYSQVFNENGGMNAVISGATVGAIMSSANEIGDSIKILEKSKILKEELSNTKPKVSKVNSELKAEVVEDIRDKMTKSTSLFEAKKPNIQVTEKLETLWKKYEILKKQIDNTESSIQWSKVRLKDYYKRLDQAVNATAKKYHIEDIEALKKAVLNGYSNQITRDNNWRNIATEVSKLIKEEELTLQVQNKNIEDINEQMNTIITGILEGENSEFSNIDKKLAEHRIKEGYYGVDQGVTSGRHRNDYFEYEYDKAGNPIRKKGTKEYFRLKESIKRKYNISDNDASRIISGIDNAGACTYAALANDIFVKYIDNPQAFERDFGFSMFTTIDGQKTFNGAELLTDMYIHFNLEENGGKLFKLERSDKWKFSINDLALSDSRDIYGRQKLNAKQQQYVINSHGVKAELMNKYLKSKNLDLEYTSENIYLKRAAYAKTILEIKMESIEAIKAGKNLQLSMFRNSDEIEMYNLYNESEITSTLNWNEGGAHEVFVTGMNKNGFIVSSWGKKYLIKYDDLKTGNFALITTEMEGILK